MHIHSLKLSVRSCTCLTCYGTFATIPIHLYLKKKRLSEICISDAQTEDTTQFFQFPHLSYSEIFVCSVH